MKIWYNAETFHKLLADCYLYAIANIGFSEKDHMQARKATPRVSSRDRNLYLLFMISVS